MCAMSLLFATLVFLLVVYPGLSFPIYSNEVHTSGLITYPSPQPNGDYYQFWIDEKRVDSGFSNYFSGSTFNFTGFFDHLYAEFLQELETTVFGEGYVTPPYSYSNATYAPGDPVGNLESVANYICTSEAEIINAFNSASSGDIIFIKTGTYIVDSLATSASNLIIAGEGWDTVLRQTAGANSYVVRGALGPSNIIVRDLTIDADRINNPTNQGFDALEFRNSPTNILVENVQVLNARHMGINFYDGSYLYTINSISIDSGWNTFELTRCTWSAAIGNYMQDARDVAMSTWGSNNIVFANNVAVYGIRDGLGFNDANWGIGIEPQGPHIYDTYNIIIRNNICDEHNAAGSNEPWKGTGIWVNEETGGGAYNLIIDGNIANNNSRAGILVMDSPTYPDGSSIVVCNNYARGNNIYDQGGVNYGNYVILRNSVVFYNNSQD